MSDAREETLRVDCDRWVMMEVYGSTIRCDGRLLAYCELDEAFAITARADEVLTDLRTGSYSQHNLLALLRQSIYRCLTG